MAWKLVLDQVNRYRNQEAKFPCRSIERCSFQKKKLHRSLRLRMCLEIKDRTHDNVLGPIQSVRRGFVLIIICRLPVTTITGVGRVL